MPDTASTIWAATGLLIAIAVICFAIYFREEIRGLFPRIRKFEAKVPRAGATFELDPHTDSTDSANSAVDSPPDEAEVGEPVDLQEDDGQSEDADETTPTIADLRIRVIDAIIAKDFERAKESQDQLADRLPTRTEAKSETVLFHLRCFLFGTGDNPLSELRKLTADPEAARAAHRAIGIALENDGDYAKAAESFETASTLEPTEGVPTFKDFLNASKAWAKNGDTDRALAAMRRAKEAAEPLEDSQESLWKGFAETFSALGWAEEKAMALDRALAENPTSADMRFDAGYAYSQIEGDAFDAASLFHYEKAVSIDPERASALNNLGVQADRLGMEGASNSFYSRSSELGNTLADANLGYHLIHAGFFDEAETVLRRAQESEKPHENVAAALTELAKQRDSEEETRRKASATGRLTAAFANELAEQAFAAPVKAVSAHRWSHAGDAILATQEGDKISLEWKEGSEKRKFEGSRRGNSVIGHSYTMGKSYFDKSKETGWQSKTRALCILRQDRIQILEISKSVSTEITFVTEKTSAEE